MSDPEIRALTPQPSAAVRLTQPMEALDLSVLFDEHLPNIAHRLADLGVARRTAVRSLPPVRPGRRRRRDRDPDLGTRA